MRWSTSQWPRCTPSNVPTVTTVPGMPGGRPESFQPAKRSGIAEHEKGVPAGALTVREGDHRARGVGERDAVRFGGHLSLDRHAARGACDAGRVERDRRKGGDGFAHWAQGALAALERVERGRIIDAVRADGHAA